MTSQSRKKRPTTVRAWSTSVARTAKALGLALLLLGSQARAQTPVPYVTGSPGAGGYQAPPPPAPLSTYQVAPGPAYSAPSQGGPQGVLAIQALPAYAVPPGPALPATRPAYSSSLQQVKYQQPPPLDLRRDTFPATPEEAKESLSITPPGFEQIFNHLDSELDLQERIRQQKADYDPNNKVVFPVEPEVSKEPYQGRDWARRAIYAEPNYVIYDRLFFENINSERYGWDLGIIGPLVDTGIAIKDMLLFPMHAGTDPFRIHEANTGYCLPGDPVAYLLYPPEVSVTGAFLEAGVIVTLLAVFP
jgi:hypothetical protein